MIDTALWWIGLAVVEGTGAALAAALFAGSNVLAVMCATHYAKRFGNLYENLRGMTAWHKAGCPVLKSSRVNSSIVMEWVVTKPIKGDVDDD